MGILDAYRNESEMAEGYGFQVRVWFPFSILVGSIVGTVMALFYIFIFFLASVFDSVFPLVRVLLGGTIVIGLVLLKIEKPKQNGISYVIKKKHQDREISPSVARNKFLSSGIALGTGLPMGKEGPALIMGSGITSWLARLVKIPKDMRSKAMTLGSAASTGALFQAPFGSAVFAAEVPYKEDADEPMMMGAFLASVTSAVIAKTIVEMVNKTWFPVSFTYFVIPEPATLEVTIFTSILALVFGAIVGLMGRGFIRFYYLYTDRVEKFDDIPRLLIGLLVALLSLGIGLFLLRDALFIPHISFYSQILFFITNANNQLIFTMIGILLLQIVATTAVIGSGFPGGIFGPSLTVGGLAGIIFALLLPNSTIGTIAAWSIVGMSASHTATTKTPIASVLLILEITGLPNLVIPIVLANLSSYAFSGSDSLYKGQITSRNVKILSELSKFDKKEFFKVKEVMTPKENVVSVNADDLVSNVLHRLISSGKRDFPVLKGNEVIGMVNLQILKKASPQSLVAQCSSPPVFIGADMNGKKAIFQMLEEDVERAPVVDENRHLLGIVSIGDIVRGISEK